MKEESYNTTETEKNICKYYRSVLSRQRHACTCMGYMRLFEQARSFAQERCGPKASERVQADKCLLLPEGERGLRRRGVRQEHLPA
eukprot:scaffold65426_cov19-Tisochrysis_lutea.AAC.2